MLCNYMIRKMILQNVSILIVVGLFSFSSDAGSVSNNVTVNKKNISSSTIETKSPTNDSMSIDNLKRSNSTDASKIVVLYFHGNARCPTCFKLENFAKSEIEVNFADAIKSGKLVWKTINVEEKGNEHFSDDYKLYTKSVIVSVSKDNKETSWKNLDKIWQLVHNEAKYREYIRSELKACIEGKCL